MIYQITQSNHVTSYISDDKAFYCAKIMKWRTNSYRVKTTRYRLKKFETAEFEV